MIIYTSPIADNILHILWLLGAYEQIHVDVRAFVCVPECMIHNITTSMPPREPCRTVYYAQCRYVYVCTCIYMYGHAHVHACTSILEQNTI